MSYEFDHHIPIYLQLIELFCQLIVNGSWAAGGKVDSVRNLAITYGVNPNTVQRALSELERDGMMYAERTSGRFITKDQALINSVRQRLASDQINQFLTQMTALGCTKQELIELINLNWRSEHATD